MSYVLFAILGVIAILLLFRLLSYESKRRNRLSAPEVADAIEKHIDETEGPHDWDYFTSIAIPDPHLDAVRLRCIELDALVLPEQRNRELKKIADELRSK